MMKAFCILPIEKDDARKISGQDLLDIPSDILPSFPADKHPLVVQGGYNNDIRMTALDILPLQIEALMQGSITVPYTDVIGDGTPITVPINNYIGGTDGRDLQAIVPAIAAGVSPFEGTTFFATTFAPDTASAQPLGNNLYSLQAKPYLLPNQLSGPGIYAEAYDMLYSLTNESPYTERTFHDLLSRPLLLNNGNCQGVSIYFNQSFTDPKMAVANVTLYHQILGTPPADIEGLYEDVYCYQANGVLVADVGVDCEDARVDPAAVA